MTTSSNLASKLSFDTINYNEQTDCSLITLSRPKKKPTTNSNYTSQGKKKASPCDPIRDRRTFSKSKTIFLIMVEQLSYV